MTDKHIPASKLLALPSIRVKTFCPDSEVDFVLLHDLRALIDAEPDVESVSCNPSNAQLKCRHQLVWGYVDNNHVAKYCKLCGYEVPESNKSTEPESAGK